MTVILDNGHLTIDALFEYVDGVLYEDEHSIVENHINECGKCSRLIEKAISIDSFLDNWTASSHAEALKLANEAELRERVNKALTEADNSEIAASVRDRLRVWKENWQLKLGGAIRVVVGMPKETSRIITTELEHLLISQGQMHFAYITGKGKVRGAGEKAEQLMSVKSEGTPEIEVELDEKKKDLMVLVRGIDDPGKLPLIFLVPESDNPLLINPEPPVRHTGTNYFILHFRRIPAGRFTLIVEPVTPG